MTDRITVTRTFTAPREVLWNVVTGREQFATWFGTEAVDVPLDTPTTPFRQRVWDELLTIPYGETRSYGAQAERIGKPKAVRAVASARSRA